VAGSALIVGYLMPFELGLAAVVVAWSLLAVALVRLCQADGANAGVYGRVALALIGAGLLVVGGAVAPPHRLFVDPQTRLPDPPFLSGATVALVSLAAALAVAGRWGGYRRMARWLGALAGALVVYALSVGVVDAFQARLGGAGSLASLRKQAQVALSILWAALGGTAFVFGIVRALPGLRVGGLGLLALATVKVFLYDLASLDATYRAPAFVGLGVLLLLSSYAYQRLKPRAEAEGPAERGSRS
jgi:uncharacterized membrane protein